MDELYQYLSVILFMGLMKGAPVRVYCTTSRLYNFPFPRSVMPGNRFEAITWNLHMSDPAEDTESDRKKDTVGYDCLFRMKPLMFQLLLACLAFYHPYQNLSIDKRMVTSQGPTWPEAIHNGQTNKVGIQAFCAR